MISKDDNFKFKNLAAISQYLLTFERPSKFGYNLACKASYKKINKLSY